jgi:hypothetical protein
MAAIGKPRVCYFGTYEKPYPRNSALIKCLTRAGAEVHECHAPVWELREDKSGSYRGLSAILTILRLFIAHLRLIVRYWRTPPHDAMIVGYVGQFDMPLAWALSRLRSVPLVYNPLVSLYDTFCNDRGLVRPGSPKGKVFRWLDRLSCRLADLVWWTPSSTWSSSPRPSGSPRKFRVIPVGADDDLFAASPLRERGPGEPFEVLFVGKLIPLHGCETILRAASLLRDEGSIGSRSSAPASRGRWSAAWRPSWGWRTSRWSTGSSTRISRPSTPAPTSAWGSSAIRRRPPGWSRTRPTRRWRRGGPCSRRIPPRCDRPSAPARRSGPAGRPTPPTSRSRSAGSRGMPPCGGAWRWRGTRHSAGATAWTRSRRGRSPASRSCCRGSPPRTG